MKNVEHIRSAIREIQTSLNNLTNLIEDVDCGSTEDVQVIKKKKHTDKLETDWPVLEKVLFIAKGNTVSFRDLSIAIKDHELSSKDALMQLGDPRRKLLNYLHGYCKSRKTYAELLGELAFCNANDEKKTKAAYDFVKEIKKCHGLRTSNTNTSTDAQTNTSLF